jgi:hypothetical protein
VFTVCIAVCIAVVVAVIVGMGTFSGVIARMVIGLAGNCVVIAVVASVPSVRIGNHSLCFSYSGRCIQKANR